MRADGRRLNTTIGVVLTDATLTKAQAAKVAAVAHDGLARAIRRCTRWSTATRSSAWPRAAADALRCRSGGLLAFNGCWRPRPTSFADACLDAVLGRRVARRLAQLPRARPLLTTRCSHLPDWSNDTTRRGTRWRHFRGMERRHERSTG